MVDPNVEWTVEAEGWPRYYEGFSEADARAAFENLKTLPRQGPARLLHGFEVVEEYKGVSDV